jgi:endonuclease III
VEAVQAAISPATWPEQKAPRIQATLREVSERLAGTPGEALGEDALDFLAALPVREARDWLERITGVGPKTSAAVLSFSRLRLPALPVDSHHHRVAQRLGLIPASVDVGPAHAWLEAQLPPDWDAQQVYDNHEVLMLHGQHVCHWREPDCPRCAVLELCPTGRARLGLDAPADLFAGADPAAGPAPATDAAAAAPERPLPPSPAPTRRRRAPGSSPASSLSLFPEPRPAPQDAHMTVNPNHAHGNAPRPERGDHNFEGAQDQDAGGDVRAESAGAKAHGTHGKGDAREELHDEVAVDTGDNPQSRRGGAGPNEAPDPAKFAKNSEGRMGGPGWGSEAAGGSSVDRRPQDKQANREHGQ